MEAGEIAPLCVMGGASDQASHPQTGNPRTIVVQKHFLFLNCQFVSDRNRSRRFLLMDRTRIFYSSTRTGWTGLPDIFRWSHIEVLSNHQIPVLISQLISPTP